MLGAGAGAQTAPVYVTASFTDKNSLYIETLERGEVRIVENGRPREIAVMARDEMTAVYGVVFDRALLPEAGYEPPRDRAGRAPGSPREIAYELIDRYLARQAVWVGVYDGKLEVALEPTSDGFRAKEAVQRLAGTRARNQSSLYAALVAAIQKMNERSEKRRVLLLLLGSVDSDTAGRVKALRNLLGASNVELFAVCFATRLGTAVGNIPFAMAQAIVKDLAQVTAGDAYFASDYQEHLDDISRRIYNQIRTLYTFGYQSEATAERPARLVIECTRAGAKVRHHPQLAALQ